ncbi:thioester reductase domain-containing protein [Nocardia sp. CA-107356]|uniref:thioester reductase domain-containing protein n=1 Tax=Nocardia sp. CA-107356 TaxID=3239972 RepID=UPI003D939DE2
MTSLEIEGAAEQIAADTELAADIQGFTPGTPAGSVSDVFLTGATGFLGVFLLEELLDRGLTVHCLVRAADVDSARDRLHANLETYDLSESTATDRIRVVPGDVTLPKFGLSDDDYAELAGRIEAIYHTAAKVNFLTPYKWLRKQTISGTHEVLRLACAATAPLHHVSTLGVFGTTENTDPRGELDTTGPAADMPLGYTKSKWVAEQLVLEADNRGVPITMHRPAQVWGDSKTGACQKNDFVWRFITGSIQAGVYPRNFRLKMNLVPVDYVCATIAAVAAQEAALGGIYHQIGPAAIDSDTIRDFIRSAGFEIKEVSIIKWLKAISADVDNAMFPLIRTTMLMEQEEPLLFTDHLTRRFLDGTGIECPSIDEKLFGTYASFFVRHGHLPAPAQSA